MSVKTIKKMIRNSETNQRCSQASFPLIAYSPVMSALANNVTRMAKQGYFIILTGHHGDLIEAPALFRDVAKRLFLQDYITIPVSKKESLYGISDAEGLFFPNAEALTIDDQMYLTRELGTYLRFVLLCFEQRNGLSPNTHFLECLLARTDRILTWPNWQERLEDHLPLVLAAKRFLEKQQQRGIVFDPDVEQYLCCRNWNSTAHLIEAILKAMKNHMSKPGASANLTMEDFLCSKQPTKLALV